MQNLRMQRLKDVLKKKIFCNFFRAKVNYLTSTKDFLKITGEGVNFWSTCCFLAPNFN